MYRGIEEWGNQANRKNMPASTAKARQKPRHTSFGRFNQNRAIHKKNARGGPSRNNPLASVKARVVCGESAETEIVHVGRQAVPADDPHSVGRRNTPTGVGKTWGSGSRGSLAGKHPHRRGEDRPWKKLAPNCTETPPQAWGRRTHRITTPVLARNTPTGVGKTRVWAASPTVQQKHPHGRGEDRHAAGRAYGVIETPPRAWGRRYVRVDDQGVTRNIPTGVGKTAGNC